MKRFRSIALAVVCCTACQAADSSRGGDDPVSEALAVADEYVAGYYDQYPEDAYETGYPAPMDRMGDQSPEAVAAWRAREDAWLARLRAIDLSSLEGSEAAIPATFSMERLEASVARRVCRTELWNVSPTWTGWQNFFPGVFAKQPVGTEAARADAVARARDVSRYVDTGIGNLRIGIEEGYTAPRSNVEEVIGQLDALLSLPPEDTPYFEPALRDPDPAFRAALADAISEEILPAARRYRDFLSDEYLAAAREEIAVNSDPGGRECYLASVLFYTTLPLTPEEIHEAGQRQMDRIHSEMREIGRRSFGTDDVRELLRRVRADPAYSFETAEQIVAFARDAVDRARDAMPEWFGVVPEAEVALKPYPDYMQVTGGGFYSAGAADGSTPGTYEFGTYDPRDLNRGGGFEATTFHETYPGHHMQVSVGLEGAGVHPVLKYFFSSGLGEGWALYSERLADEAGLYTADVDRLGMLSNEAYRAARLVVDPGMHALGWTREQAVDYMLANTASSRGEIESEVSRYIAVPGQATAYLTGSLVIQDLRQQAEMALGDRFDIRKFHDRVIRNGTITLPMLRAEIEAWIAAEKQAAAPEEI
ncbi:MAG: DUF885 domain-containing protein [Candidatus Palauibacterales bacterium]|nr:DUF885 domain-containing protein [Candidatus Palauibacterales bacterium]MDP2482572.1 DUF885 domain-containing protein [Candidatus Palauibacterales bacterium]